MRIGRNFVTDTVFVCVPATHMLHMSPTIIWLCSTATWAFGIGALFLCVAMKHMRCQIDAMCRERMQSDHGGGVYHPETESGASLRLSNVEFTVDEVEANLADNDDTDKNDPWNDDLDVRSGLRGAFQTPPLWLRPRSSRFSTSSDTADGMIAPPDFPNASLVKCQSFWHDRY